MTWGSLFAGECEGVESINIISSNKVETALFRRMQVEEFTAMIGSEVETGPVPRHNTSESPM